MFRAAQRSQASIDMLIAYGVAILLVSIAMYVVLQLGVFNSRITPSYCNPAPSFTCSGYAVDTKGVFTLVFAQSTGATINITGMACSDQQNTSDNAPPFSSPKYGNINMLAYKGAPQFYPNNQLQNGLIVYSSNQTRVFVNCYDGSGLAKGPLGDGFSGFIWINYTISTLPGNYPNREQIIAFSTKYT